jgi:predicted DNA-binding protein (UPF0251 family)
MDDINGAIGKVRYFSMVEAASVIGITRQRMWQIIQAGRFTGARINSNGQWRIPKNAVLEFAKTKRATNGSHRYNKEI